MCVVAMNFVYPHFSHFVAGFLTSWKSSVVSRHTNNKCYIHRFTVSIQYCANSLFDALLQVVKYCKIENENKSKK